jgi:hypothetical protein
MTEQEAQKAGELAQALKDRIMRSNSPTHLHYECILKGIAEIREEKVRLYGESAYNGTDPDEDCLERMLDIKRKFCRLQQLTRLLRAGDLTALPLLVDAYRDIANYAVMGVQILEKHYPEQPLDLT